MRTRLCFFCRCTPHVPYVQIVFLEFSFSYVLRANPLSRIRNKCMHISECNQVWMDVAKVGMQFFLYGTTKYVCTNDHGKTLNTTYDSYSLQFPCTKDDHSKVHAHQWMKPSQVEAGQYSNIAPMVALRRRQALCMFVCYLSLDSCFIVIVGFLLLFTSGN